MNFTDYKEGADALTSALSGFKPEILLILGSGLGFLGDVVEDPIFIPYEKIPHMKISTAPGHAGRFAAGMLSGRRVIVMQGRIHMYEGYSAQEVAYPVRISKLAGVNSVIITNAAGGVNKTFKVGDIMLIRDHINLFGPTPLTGPNIEQFGVRFCDMTYAYTPRLKTVIREAAKEMNINIREGVYSYFPGPQFETPAEVRAARAFGADAVGMSTVPEAVAAAHAGMEMAGLSLISNMAAGVTDKPLSGDEVNAVAEASREKFSRLILAALEHI